MTNLLDDPTVRKYFGCQPEHNHYGDLAIKCRNERATELFDAMWAGKKIGDLCLRWTKTGFVEERLLSDHDGGQPNLLLRLPDRFQKKECGCNYTCPFCGSLWCWNAKPHLSPEDCSQRTKTDVAVEEKTKEIINTAFADGAGVQWITKRLRELVDLARRTR